jgi:fucokinase
MYIDSGNMVFFHFGTSAEILDHLEDDRGGRLARNYFTAIPSCGTCDVAPSAVILVAELRQGVSIGAGRLVFDCMLYSSIQIGACCVVTGVHSSNQSRPSKHVLLDSLPLGGASFSLTSGLPGDAMFWHK